MNRTARLSKSDIEYLDYVWNFESGCTKGCTACYAKKIATRFPGHYPNGFEPTLYPEAFTSPLRLKRPSTIGVCFMGDLFDDAIDPGGWQANAWTLRARIFNTIRLSPQHRFLFLTKQPQNLAKWSPFPDNCWVGVSVTDSSRFAMSLAHLQDVKAKVKYISFEPLLGPIRAQPFSLSWWLKFSGINWLIIGAQTKPTVRPDIGWVKEIVAAADAAGIPVFLKNSLRPLRDKTGILLTKDKEGYNTLRQEMPGD